MICFISNNFNNLNCPDLLPIFLLYSFAVDKSIKWTESQNILALKRSIKSIVLLYSFSCESGAFLKFSVSSSLCAGCGGRQGVGPEGPVLAGLGHLLDIRSSQASIFLYLGMTAYENIYFTLKSLYPHFGKRSFGRKNNVPEHKPYKNIRISLMFRTT